MIESEKYKMKENELDDCTIYGMGVLIAYNLVRMRPLGVLKGGVVGGFIGYSAGWVH